jgi:hypothetical protein
VWCIAAFYLLPFQLEGRMMTFYGFAILALFIATFCFGAVLASPVRRQLPRRPDLSIDFLIADRILMTVAVIAIIASAIDARGHNLFDLADAYQVRSDRAGALMIGADSDSSIFFQISFLTYPAGYVYLIREIAFRPRPLVWKVAVFGLAPVVLASLAMGGRAPLFYAFLMLVLGFNLRKHVFPQKNPKNRSNTHSRFGLPGAFSRERVFKLGFTAKTGITVIGVMSFIYFIQVFFTRADVAGGVDAMFGVAGKSWGVNFNGRFSDFFFTVLGPQGAYLVFVFVWYLVQGLVMSNAIFTDYSGSPMFGTYGIDLMSALMRRLNGQFVADGFSVLLQMNTYGFLPSAFGSLFVDLKFFGLVPCFLWGWLVGKLYQQIRRGRDPRWLILAPFVTLGIVFSLINTPIGFSNGLMIQFWMLVAFFSSKVVTPKRVLAGDLKPSFA